MPAVRHESYAAGGRLTMGVSRPGRFKRPDGDDRLDIMNRPQSQLAAGDPSPSTGGRIEDVASASSRQSAAISPLAASGKSSRSQALAAAATLALAAVLS